MNSREAHQMVLGMAEESIKNLPDTEARNSAIQITRRDLNEQARRQDKDTHRRRAKDPHDDMSVTLAQVKVLYAKWTTRSMEQKEQTFIEFLDTVRTQFGNDDSVMVEWCGMWVGIETDGYAHT